MHQDFLPPGIVILTGAGISKESGIDTFRDKDGLWTRVNLEEVATIEAWHRDKKKVLDFYNDTRRSFRAAHIEPNAAHRATTAAAARRSAGACRATCVRCATRVRCATTRRRGSVFVRAQIGSGADVGEADVGALVDEWAASL